MFEPSHNSLPCTVLVPKEQLGNWRRWRTQELKTQVPTTDLGLGPDEAAREAASLQVELAAIREQARETAYAMAYAAGHAKGLADGNDEGLKAGHEEGHRAGLQEGLALATERADALNALLEQSAQAIEALSTDVSAALTGLALDIARRVIGSEIQASPDSINALVQDILQTGLTGHGAVQLSLHPDDAELVKANLSDSLAERQWQISPDAGMERGDCRAQSAFGDIDATLKTRWQQVAATLGSTAPWQAP